MIMVMLVVVVFVVAAGFAVMFAQLAGMKRGSGKDSELKAEIMTALGGLEQRLKSDLSLYRREQAEALKSVGDSLDRRMSQQAQVQRTALEQMTQSKVLESKFIALPRASA